MLHQEEYLNDNIHIHQHQYEAIAEHENEATDDMQQSELPETQELDDDTENAYG